MEVYIVLGKTDGHSYVSECYATKEMAEEVVNFKNTYGSNISHYSVLDGLEVQTTSGIADMEFYLIFSMEAMRDETEKDRFHYKSVEVRRLATKRLTASNYEKQCYYKLHKNKDIVSFNFRIPIPKSYFDLTDKRLLENYEYIIDSAAATINECNGVDEIMTELKDFAKIYHVF